MKDFGKTKRPDMGTDDPAAAYRKTVKFVQRQPGTNGKDEAVIRIIGGIKLVLMYWFKSPTGKRFAITSPYFDEDTEECIPGKCPVFDNNLTNGAVVWAVNAINRHTQREEHNPNPVEVFPCNKTEFNALMDLHEEHGPPNSVEQGYDIVTRKWKEKGVPKCSISIKMSMEGSSRTPLEKIEASYPKWDMDLLYQPKAETDYILDVIKACLLSPEIGGEGKYTPDDFKRDFEKYLPKDEQSKKERAFAGILKRYYEFYGEGGEDSGEPASDGRAPAMMAPGGATSHTTPAPAPMGNTPMQTPPATAATAAPTPPPSTPAPSAPPPTAAAPATPPPTAPSTPPPAASTPAPPATGADASTAPMPPAPAPTNQATAPPPTPPSMNPPSAGTNPPPTPPPSAGLSIPPSVNPATPPSGMPNPENVMSQLAPPPTGGLGSIDD